MSWLRPVAILSAFFLCFISFGTAEPVPRVEGGSAEYNRRGMQLYSEAFYQKRPQGKYREAERLFDLAAREFKNAIAASPKDVKAHRNLARLYYVRKEFVRAAQLYTKLTALEPNNMDAYVQLALCYTRLDRFDEAIYTLEIAKTRTDIPEVIEKLDEYIQRIVNSRLD